MVAIRHIRLAFLLILLSGLTSTADDRTAAELLPATTVLYVEVPRPQALLEVLLEHPLRKKVEQLKDVRKGLESKQFLQFKAVVSLIEAKFGKAWPKILAETTGGGIAFGFDAETEGAVLLIKAVDEKALPQLLETLTDLARADAKEKGNPDPIKSAEYRGITAYQLDQAKVAVVGEWLMVTNKPASGKTLLDALLDKPENRLAASDHFKQARASAPEGRTAWAYINVEAVRSSGAAKELFVGKTDNFVAELLIGGLLDALQHTPFATASLDLQQRRTLLELTTPHHPQWRTEAREYFFGPDGGGRAPAPIEIANQLLSLTTYRDVSTMWLRADDLFDAKVVDQLAQAESNLTTFFSGKDFAEEILGEVRPEIQIVAARQTYVEGAPQPAIKIPAFALVFRMKDPETIQPEFRRTFHSLIGFLNIVGSMNGQPQLDLDIEKEDAFQLVTANYLVEKDASNLSGLKIHYNFSPSVAFAGEHFIVSSTAELARELAAAVHQSPAPPTGSNSTISLNIAGIGGALADNRAQLVAQNMLSDGNTKAEAEQEISDLLSLLSTAQDAQLDFVAGDDALRASLEISYNQE